MAGKPIARRAELSRKPGRVQARYAADSSEYFEFVCNTCHSILLTFQRLGTQSAER
jgi:cytochrome c5